MSDEEKKLLAMIWHGNAVGICPTPDCDPFKAVERHQFHLDALKQKGLVYLTRESEEAAAGYCLTTIGDEVAGRLVETEPYRRLSSLLPERAEPEPKEEFGWCFKCNSPCFLLLGTCRGCAAPAAVVPAEMHTLYNETRIQRDKLREFKAYVHDRLDKAGVTADPESPHKAAGCRVGGRLDELIGERDQLRAEPLRARKRVAALEEFIEWALFAFRLNSHAETEGWVKDIAQRARRLVEPADATS